MLRLKTIPTREHAYSWQAASLILIPNSKFFKHFTPGREVICVDRESAVEFKGRISFVTRNAKKSTKRGIGVYTTADSNTGYFFLVLRKFGNGEVDKARPSGINENAVAPLCDAAGENIPGARGHRVFTELRLGRRVVEIEMPPDGNCLDE